MARKANWAAVSAVAAAVSALVAFLAYAAPHNTSPSPGTVTVTPSEPSASVPTASVTTPATTPPLSLAPLPPAGCTNALAAVDTYYRSAGSTTLSQDAAASQAYQDMMRASLETNGGAVYTVTVALSRDFSTMRFILEGMESGDYTQAQRQTSSDAQTLQNVCASR